MVVNVARGWQKDIRQDYFRGGPSNAMGKPLRCVQAKQMVQRVLIKRLLYTKGSWRGLCPERHNSGSSIHTA